MIHFLSDLFTTSLPLAFLHQALQSMKFEILSFVADAVLLLLILFMFCHFVRLSALSFSLSHSFRFNNIYNITNGGQTRVPREGE